MFGERLDYHLLKPFTHDRGLESEEDLNLRFAAPAPFDMAAAMARMAKLKARYDGHLRIEPNLRYLDVGCGRGDLDLALINEGATDVTGIDTIARNIDASKVAAQDAGMDDRAHFVCANIHTWQPKQPFDAVFSHEALEHISEPGEFIARLSELVIPGGTIYLAFGPLFHSPFGDHLDDFFKIPVPWRGVLFNERALMRLRREQFRPGDPVDRFEDVAGGMNKMRYSAFLSHLQAAGLEVVYMGLNPQLKRLPALKRIAEPLTRLPVVRDFTTVSVYSKLRRRL